MVELLLFVIVIIHVPWLDLQDCTSADLSKKNLFKYKSTVFVSLLGMYMYQCNIHISRIIGTTYITLQCVINCFPFCFGRISNLPKAVDTVCGVVLYAVLWSMCVYGNG